MKRFYFLVVVGVVVLGWHGAWMLGYDRLSDMFEHKIAEIEQNQQAMNLDVSYVLTPYGYPFNIGFNVEKLSANVEDQNKVKAHIDISGKNRVYMKIWDLPLVYLEDQLNFHVNIENLEAQFKVDAEEDKSSVELNIARYIAQGSVGEQVLFSSVASDLDFYVESDDVKHHRFLTVNNVETKTEREQVRDVVYLRENATIKGAVLFDYETNESWEIDRVNVAFKLDGFPNSEEFFNALTDVSKQKAQGDVLNMVEFKKKTKKFISAMAENNSRFQLNDYSIDMGEFQGKVSGDLSLNSSFVPEGKFVLDLKNVDALQVNAKLADGVSPSALSFGLNNVMVEAEIASGLLLVNGLPILPVESLDRWVDKIPDEIKLPKAAVDSLEDEVGKETDDLKTPVEEAPTIDEGTSSTPLGVSETEDTSLTVSL